ncbi:MAG TPA: phenylalanine--tRNA ligase subunit beta [Thermodesulfobacteriota bacterium]|nr:phenylalanine--tRNA ligase subunit beta [Thermodesulfobacteriota bacterium]
MRFTLSWLKEYVDFDASPEELAERLTMVGLEVESIEYMGMGLEDVFVAEILDIRPHPNASKLVICDVTDGSKLYNIVCGAKNMKAGDKVALAKAGTRLPPSVRFPEGLLIQSTKIRGELSEGMLCAENELGIGEDGEGILILPEYAMIGERLVDALGLNDVVIGIGVTPNRPDCLSVIGIAREVAAILATKVKYPDYGVLEEGEDIENLAAVEVLDVDGCPRYSCRLITDVKIAPSPDWLKTRLEASGIRSINNVVDVTNFILLELGQPLHAFDHNLLVGRKIIVRPAKNGELFETIDRIKKTLTNEDLVICDARKPIALAGVMGGSNTEISEKTRNILLESAYFNPARVRRSSKRTNLKSESSYRFERGVDPNGVVKALDRASELIRKVAKGKVAKGKIDIYPSPIRPKEVEISTRRINSILGTDIKTEKIKEIAERLEIQALTAKDGEISLCVPTFRVDLMRETDLIEEVARHYGYNSIPLTLPVVPMKTENSKREKNLENKVKEILPSFGFLEVVNYSFDDSELLSLYSEAEQLKILNPLTKESSVMRTNLIVGILRNVSLNLNHQVQDIRIFEIGKVYFSKAGGLPKEITKISGAATGKRQLELWDKEEFDFFDMKGILERVFEAFSISQYVRFVDSSIRHVYPEQGRRAHDSPQDDASEIRFLHPGKSARVLAEGEELGFFGELHPEFQEKLGLSKRVYIFEIDLEKLISLEKTVEKKFVSLPKFPYVRRDIALVVDDNISLGEILNEIRRMKSPLIEDLRVFDVFKGGNVSQGKKSIAVSMILRASDKTLTDEEVNEVQKMAISGLQKALGAELRKT